MEVFERLESEVRGYCRVYPAVFARAKNARQWDTAGNEYIDFFAGAGVLNYGHNNDRIKKKLMEFLEADGVVHSLDLFTTAKQSFLERFEKVILEPRDMRYKLQFTGPTGTNAVEASLKLARKITGRAGIVAFTDGFHGMTLGALACTGNGLHRGVAGVTLDHVTRVPYDGYLGEGVDTLESLRRQLADPSSGVVPPAAFIVEVVQAEGGVNVATAEWLRDVQELAHQHGSLFIVDDIQVGMGRTGTFFSFEGMGIEPDVVCLAKGLGGYGTPIAMLMIKPERDKWGPGEHTGTFRGPGLSFVAGAEALSFFEDDALMNDVARKGAHTDERLAAMAKKHGAVKTVRSRGMIHGVECTSGDAAKKAIGAAFEDGAIFSTCGPGGKVIKLIAPLTIEDDVLDKGLDILDASLGKAS